MKKLLIHLHLYYPEYCTELSQCIESLMPEYNFDLFVTLPKQNSYLSQKILASFPNANIQVVENIGFDIYPFVKVIKSVNLDDYSYVIKLHTKRDINFNMFSFFKNKWFGGGNWREGLLSFIKSKENFKLVLSYLNNHEQVGMHGGQAYILNQFTDDKNAKKSVTKFINRKSYEYVAGAIFIAKAKVFKLLQTSNIDASKFETSDQNHQNVQFAHTMERYLGYCVTSNNLEIKDCFTPKIKGCFISIHKYLSQFIHTYILNIRITNKQKLLIKFCKIPVYNRAIKNKVD